MANIRYNAALQAFLKGEINWEGAVPVKVMLIRTSQGPNAGGNAVYSVDPTDSTLADVPDNSYCRATEGVALTNRVATAAGEADADDVTFTAVPAGDPIGAVILYLDPAEAEDDEDRPLIAYFDDGESIPVTPNGGDLVVEWEDESPYIFSL